MARKHGFTRTHAKFHKDGSSTVHHVSKDGPHADKRHAVPSLDHLHDSIQDHLGSPNPGEMEADAGQHGIPEPVAQAAAPAGPASPAGGMLPQGV